MLDRIKALTTEKTRRFESAVGDAREISVIRGEIDKFKMELDFILDQMDRTNDQQQCCDVPLQMRNNMDDTVQNLLVDRVNWGCARTGFIYHRGGTNTTTAASRAGSLPDTGPNGDTSGWLVAPESGDILTANRAELITRLARVRRDISRKRGEL